MQQLQVDDLRAVVELGHAAGEMSRATLRGLAGLVGADTATLTHLDLHTGQEVAVFWPGERSTKTRLDVYGEVGIATPYAPCWPARSPARPVDAPSRGSPISSAFGSGVPTPSSRATSPTRWRCCSQAADLCCTPSRWVG